MNVLKEILKLPKEERIKLVETVWDSIEQEEKDAQLSDDQLSELRRRRAAYDAGNMPVYSWEEVRSSIIKG
jgi:putative addiction module component (TIGR02574 family)